MEDASSLLVMASAGGGATRFTTELPRILLVGLEAELLLLIGDISLLGADLVLR